MNLRLIRLGLSWLGVLGIGVTSWISVKCSKKAEQETETKKKVLAYAPAIASGVATAACVLGINGIAGKEIATLGLSCAYMAKNRDKLEAKLTPQQRIEAKKEIAPWEGPSIEWTGNGDMICLEGYSGRMFYSSKEAVEKAFDELNERFVGGEYVCLNDLYELLGIEKTHFGDQFGWCANADYYSGPIEYKITEDYNENGEKMLLIDIFTYPIECWREV